MAKWWKPVLVLLITFALAVSIKSDFAFFLLGFEVMMCIAAYIQVRMLAKRVDMRILLPKTVAYKNEKFIVQVELSNKSIFPVTQLQVNTTVRSFPEKESLLLKGKLMLNSREKGTLNYELNGSHCGCMEISCGRLVITDFLGIFQKKCSFTDTEIHRMFILPENLNARKKIPDIKASTPFDDGGEDKRGSSAVDSSEIRDYRKGDLIKHIHWKLSARLSQLMVRELSDPTEKLVWIHLNLREEDEKNRIRNNPDKWDEFVDAVASVSLMLNNVNMRHFVFWVDDATKRIVKNVVSSEESLQEMICNLLRTDTYYSADNNQLLKEIYLDEEKGTCVEIDLQGNVVSTED